MIEKFCAAIFNVVAARLGDLKFWLGYGDCQRGKTLAVAMSVRLFAKVCEKTIVF